MTVSPQSFLDLANLLINNQEEIDARSATNRAYYGAFHACKHLLSSKTLIFKPKGRGSHQKLIHAFLNYSFYNQDGLINNQTNSIHFIGQMLSELKPLRDRADYNIKYDYPVDDAFKAIQLSKKIILTVEQILTPP